MAEYQSDDAFGDGWHDNFAYEQAIQKDNSLSIELNKKIKDIENIVIVEKMNDKSIVDLGAIVELDFGDNKNEKYVLTGGYNSNFDAEIPEITINSPLGMAIYKKKINEVFEYEVGNNSISGRIMSIVYR